VSLTNYAYKNINGHRLGHSNNADIIVVAVATPSFAAADSCQPTAINPKTFDYVQVANAVYPCVFVFDPEFVPGPPPSQLGATAPNHFGQLNTVLSIIQVRW
jgi:hypothetical protein